MKEISIEFQQDEFTLGEICERCVVDSETIIQLVNHGVVEPGKGSTSDWRFSALSYLRIRKALRLKNDLALNDAGIALVLDLLERLQEANRELDYLRMRLRGRE